MTRTTFGMFLLLGLCLGGCGGDDKENDGSQGGSATGGSATAGSTTGGSTEGGSGGSSGSGSGAKPSSGGGMPPATPPGSTPTPMPIISKDVPAFASSNTAASLPEKAQDLDPQSNWTSTAVPAWLAYDLSGVPAAEREQVLIAWYTGATLDFINDNPNAGQHLPIDYSLELNMAEGGGEAPEDGWEVIESVTGNDRNTRQRLVRLDGANWIRINVTKSSAADEVGLDLDVHSAPEGATDSWLFMGDSITFMSTSYLFSDLPALVNALAPERYPAIIPGAIGGTNTNTALLALETTMENFPGRFVVLAYGTNDHPNDYHMDELVQRVIDAGKVPAVPHMPWAPDESRQMEAVEINAMIDALYEKHPEIYRGPDLYSAFEGRTDLIPTGDIHPNDEGQAELRKHWAEAMTR
jgi:hypothetical protein